MRARACARPLRVAVVRDRALVEERLFEKGPVTLGSSPRSNLLLTSEDAPRCLPLFEQRDGAWWLVADESIDGRVAGVGGAEAMAALRERAPVSLGQAPRIRLDDGARGRLLIAGVPVLFQVAQPRREAPERSPAMRRSLWGAMDRTFAAIAAAALATNFGVAKAITWGDLPPPEELPLDEGQLERVFKGVIIPPKVTLAEQPAAAPVAGQGAPAAPRTPSLRPAGPAADARPAPSREEGIRASVSNDPFIKLIGSLGEGGEGAASGTVFSDGFSAKDLDGVLAESGGRFAVADVSGGGLGGRKGSDAGTVQGIGALGTRGGAGEGERALGPAAPVRGPVVELPDDPLPVTGDCDGKAIAQVVKRNLGGVQLCYEREIKRNPTASGRVEVRFTIGPEGRVTEAEVEEDELRSVELERCMIIKVRSWIFPAAGKECFVGHPFILTPSDR